MNVSAVGGGRAAVGLSLLLLLVVCNEARTMSSNGSSSRVWLQPFCTNLHSESESLSSKTSFKTASSVASEMNYMHEDDRLHTVCESNESPSRHQVEENWFPDTTYYERNRLEFNTTQNKYERQSNSVRVQLSYERLYSRSKVRVRSDSRKTDLKEKSRIEFQSSFERREADLRKKLNSEDRDEFGRRSDTRSRESRSKGRDSLDERTTRLKRESRNQVRDGSDRFHSRRDSRREGRSSLYRRMADLRRELFRFQLGIHHDMGRSDLGLWKESRTEGRNSVDRSGSGRTHADLKRYSRNIVRDDFERSYSRMKSRSEVNSVLGKRMVNSKIEFQNQVRDVFDLRNESRSDGRRSMSLDRRHFKRVDRNQVKDGLETSALRSTFRNKGGSSLDRRIADFTKESRKQVAGGFERSDSRMESRSEGRRIADFTKESRRQVRNGFERSDIMRNSRSEGRRIADFTKESRKQVAGGFERSDSRMESRSEGRRIADFTKESRRQVRNGFERSDIMRNSRSEGRRIADFTKESRRQVRSGFERSDSRIESRSEGRRIADFTKASRRQVRSGFERSDIMRNSRSEDGSSLESRSTTDLRKASLSQVRDVAGNSDSRMEFRHGEGRRRFERIATDSTKKLKRGFTRNSGDKIRSNLNLKVGDSNRHRSLFVNRTEWIVIPLEIPVVHNSDVGQQLDRSFEYLQNHEMNRRSERHCAHTIIDKHLSYCSSDISVLSLNDYRLDGWFRKENDTYDYPLRAVSLLSVGAANPIASTPFMMAS